MNRLFAALALTLFVAAPAWSQARMMTTPPPAAFADHIGEQLRSNLRTGSTADQIDAMRLVVQIRQRHQAVDLDAAVPELLRVYETASTRAQRLLALSALNAVHSPLAMNGLRHAVQDERTTQIRKATWAALAAYDQGEPDTATVFAQRMP